MKKAVLISVCTVFAICCTAQTDEPFTGKFQNEEYGLTLSIALETESVEVPRHELYGELPGYLVKTGTNYYWLITSADIDGNKARVSLINDYGSEDLEATLTLDSDTLLWLKQGNGSTIKVPNKGKWVKLPGTLGFIRK